MLWRYYYAIKKNNYLKTSIILISTFSIFAVILNIEGSNCLSKINSLINEQKLNKTAQTQAQTQQQQSESQQNQNENEIRESVGLINYCFLVTNLYVYSLFGIIIGIMIIAIWYMKYKKIWSNIIKRNR
ncbi:MAG: hypothetical protein WKF36_03500 [Candidatus Nitrosocosmicus sp.]